MALTTTRPWSGIVPTTEAAAYTATAHQTLKDIGYCNTTGDTITVTLRLVPPTGTGFHILWQRQVPAGQTAYVDLALHINPGDALWHVASGAGLDGWYTPLEG